MIIKLGECMAKLHTKKKGKSGSRKVKGRKKWVELSAKEIEKIIINLQAKGTRVAEIGIILRDLYGVPDIKERCGKSVTKIIEEKVGKVEYSDDILDLIKKAVNIRKHLEKNKSDTHNRVKLTSVEAKIRRIGEYYSRIGKLPSDWSYDPQKARLLVK